MNRNFVLAIVLIAIAGAIFYLESVKTTSAPQSTFVQNENGSIVQQPVKYKPFPRAQELQGISGFINTGNITIRELIGKKVILVDFWTYSCINCQRTTPYLNAWYEKYKGKGLEIIGVHTPEFEFEKDYDNVKKAVEKFGIKYPVALDNDYATWKAYHNRYWPRKYLIDIDGYIAYDHIGEGGYEETEAKIQELLEERMQTLGLNASISRDMAEPKNKTDVDFSKIASPETYFGAFRNANLANGNPLAQGVQNLSQPLQIERNSLYLTGEWNFSGEYAENGNAGAKIIFKYKAKNVYLVASADETVEISVTLDGKQLSAEAGGDVSVEGGKSLAKIGEDRLYKLIEGKDYGEHTLEMTVGKPGLKAFAFTFG